MGKTERALELAREGKTRTEIIELVPCSDSTARLALKKAKKERELEEGRPPAIEVTGEEKERVVPFEEEEEAEVIEPTEGFPPELIPKLVTAQLTTDETFQLWQSVNLWLPKKHRRDEDAINVLAKVWVNPLNRILAKYAEENADIIIAIICTVIVFSPAMKDIAQEKMKERKEKEGEEKE